MLDDLFFLFVLIGVLCDTQQFFSYNVYGGDQFLIVDESDHQPSASKLANFSWKSIYVPVGLEPAPTRSERLNGYKAQLSNHYVTEAPDEVKWKFSQDRFFFSPDKIFDILYEK